MPIGVQRWGVGEDRRFADERFDFFCFSRNLRERIDRSWGFSMWQLILDVMVVIPGNLIGKFLRYISINEEKGHSFSDEGEIVQFRMRRKPLSRGAAALCESVSADLG